METTHYFNNYAVHLAADVGELRVLLGNAGYDRSTFFFGGTFFLNNPDEECIPLFLNSFGGKDGFGVYQVVEGVVMKYDKETVMPHALKALNNESENVKYWCIQIISNFPDNRLFKPLVELLELEDEDIKAATITALAQY